jgi:hypothetical protein
MRLSHRELSPIANGGIQLNTEGLPENRVSQAVVKLLGVEGVWRTLPQIRNRLGHLPP